MFVVIGGEDNIIHMVHYSVHDYAVTAQFKEMSDHHDRLATWMGSGDNEEGNWMLCTTKCSGSVYCGSLVI